MSFHIATEKIKFTYLYHLSVYIEANIYGSVENTAKLNKTHLVVTWNSMKSLSDTSDCNIIGHRSAADRAVLTAEDVIYCSVQQNPYYVIHYLYRNTAKIQNKQ